MIEQPAFYVEEKSKRHSVTHPVQVREISPPNDIRISGVPPGAIVTFSAHDKSHDLEHIIAAVETSALTRTEDSQRRRTVRVCWNGSDCLASPFGST
jgi:hypothetical protein